MKKQLLLAAISVALLTAPYAEAGSGFSRGSSSSSKSSSSSSPNRSSSSSSSSGGSAAPASRNYGSASSFSRNADTPRTTTPSYAPQYRATPVAVAAPVAAPKTSGFSGAAPASTTRKVAAVAGGTALGGALYAAQANHDAVAAYEKSQRPAPAPSPSVASSNPNYAPRPTIASTSGYQVPQQQTHVVVVHEEPHHHYYSQPDPTTAYVAGMIAGERHARYQERDRGYYGSPVQSAAPSVATTTAPAVSQAATPNNQTTAPAVATSPAPAEKESHTGLVIFLTLLALSAGGVYAYYALRIKRGPKAPNYTL